MLKNNPQLGLAILAASCLTLASVPARSASVSFQVVANAGVSITSLSHEQVSQMFLKKLAKWPDGKKVAAVDQARSAPIRESFSKSVHGRDASALVSYWQQQIFSGGDVPPPEKANDAEVLTFVRSTPGAIGYVSSTAGLGDGVRVVTVR
jgi:ABC-type phosphate transport system substrate-binding protein